MQVGPGSGGAFEFGWQTFFLCGVWEWGKRGVKSSDDCCFFMRLGPFSMGFDQFNPGCRWRGNGSKIEANLLRSFLRFLEKLEQSFFISNLSSSVDRLSVKDAWG
jgi:hypothetical protein